MRHLYRAPAKINLTLEVLARRADGYHALRSLMVPLALADELRFESSERFDFACDVEELAGDENLVVRALRAIGTPAVRVHLSKRIPTQAGLGGGSSDAATVLRAAIDGAFGVLTPFDWVRIARDLGSDVPFFLAGTGALVEGTGERVTPIGELPPWHVLIVKPPVATSTAQAYAWLDAIERPTRRRKESVSIAALTALQRGDFADLEALLQNDFHDVGAARAPEIAFGLDALRAAGSRNALLAGSGSSFFTLARERASIDRILERLVLPASYQRFATTFATTPDWRGPA